SGTPVCLTAGRQSVPFSGSPISLQPMTTGMVPGGEGGTILSWFDRRKFEPLLFSRVIYVQRGDAEGQRRWGADGVQITDQYTGYLSMISDDDGGAILSWSDDRISPNHQSVFAQRVRQDGKLGGPQGPKSPIEAPPPATSIVTGSQMA